MTDAGWALQTAVYGRVIADASVLALLGGAHVYDHVPRRTPLPYVTFAASVMRDNSTGCDEAHEHTLTLRVWTKARGRKQMSAVMLALRAALHEQALVLDGHHLVGIRHEFSEIRRDEDGEQLIGSVRFRAVTEPL